MARLGVWDQAKIYLSRKSLPKLEKLPDTKCSLLFLVKTSR